MVKSNTEKQPVKLTWKTEYITKTLARTFRKNYENYVITRIWHKLNRYDIKFITQQYVSRRSGYALVDLYLPQLNMFIEVDEPPHNPTIDEIREKDIIILDKGIRFKRIIIAEEYGKERLVDIKKVDEQCDALVLKIKRRIRALSKSKAFKPWDEKEDDPQTYIKRGQISLADSVAFSRCADAANCFGHRYKNLQRGGVKHPLNDDTLIWFPKLYPHGEWQNEISEDGSVIRESNIDKKKNKIEIQKRLESPRKKRIVFAHGKDKLGIQRYRFKGVFELDREETDTKQCAVWKRIAEVIKTFPPKPEK